MTHKNDFEKDYQNTIKELKKIIGQTKWNKEVARDTAQKNKLEELIREHEANLYTLEQPENKTTDGLKVSKLKTACIYYGDELDQLIDKQLIKIRKELFRMIRSDKANLEKANIKETSKGRINELESTIKQINDAIDPNVPTMKGEKLSELKSTIKQINDAIDPNVPTMKGEKLRALIQILPTYVDITKLESLIARKNESFTLLFRLKSTEYLNNAEKLKKFHLFFSNHSPNILSAKESSAKKFIAALKHILKTIKTFGYHAYADAKKRGSSQFWKTPEEILRMKKSEVMEENIGKKMKKQ